MVAAIAKWRTRTGHRFTSPSDDLSVDVEAVTAIASEDGIASVTFTINGSDTVVTTETLRRPNFNTEVSPRTGTTAMRPFSGYGVTIRAEDYDAGAITITATVTSGIGTETNLPGSIVIYNDKDGTDRRPSTKVIYVNADTGDDGNDGSSGSPVLGIQKACEMAATVGDLGGASVVLQASTAPHDWCRGYGGVGDLFTSGHWWFRIIVEVGAKIRRPGAIAPQGGITYTPGPDDLVLNSGASGNDMRCLLVLKDSDNKQVDRGDLKVWVNPSTFADLSVEGGRWGSRFHSASNRWSVLFTDERAGLWDVVSGSTNYERHAYCCVAEGVSFGWFGWSNLHDCEVRDFTGIAMQTTGGHSGGESALNLFIGHQRYDATVKGLIDSVVGGKVSVTVVGGRMRIQQLASTTIYAIGGGAETSQETDLAFHAEELLGAYRWGVVTVGFAEGGNNSPVITAGTVGLGGRREPFQVLAVGTSGGLPWIELDNPSAVAEATAQAGAQLWTALNSNGSDEGQTYVEAVHPDVCQFFSHLTDALWSGVVVSDLQGAQSWFFSSFNFTRVALRNVSDAGHTFVGLTVPLSMTDCLFFHCTIGGAWDWGGATYTGLEFRQCVIGSSNGLPAAAVIDGCHFITATPQGTDSSSGSWFAGDPSVSPWSREPSAGNLGTASTDALAGAAEFRWSGAGGSATRGVWRDVGLDLVLPTTMVGAGASVGQVAAADGEFSVGVADVVMEGAGASVGTIAAPDGEFAVGPLDVSMEGPGASVGSVAAPQGSFSVGAVGVAMEGPGASVGAVSAPSGEFSVSSPSVVLAGPGASLGAISAPTGTMTVGRVRKAPGRERRRSWRDVYRIAKNVRPSRWWR